MTHMTVPTIAQASQQTASAAQSRMCRNRLRDFF